MMSGRCAACKNQRRRCPSDCIFSPYFPANDPQRFASVHKIYGGSNVGKMLQVFYIHNNIWYQCVCVSIYYIIKTKYILVLSI